MMAHFNKLQTPLGAIQKYPTKYAQEERFVSLGWAHASALNLWELWSSPDFISSGQRSSLDEVEPFDEWEEFALFGCHYFLLVADNSVGPPQHIQANPHRSQGTQARSEIRYSQNCKSQGLRRFAAALPVRISGQTDDGFGVFAGMGKNTRTASCDIYTNHPTLDGQASSFIMNGGPSSRVCHTITDLGETGSLLVGGRTSPDNALSDCWLYHKWINIWERIDDIPQARYRHSAIELGNGFALISPGRTSSRNTTADFFIWSRLFGWRRCNSASDDAPPATYGATFTLFDSASPAACRKGILAGGISKYGIVQEGIWLWEVLQHKSKVGRYF
jgi:tRNA wybutosine-synthesizing protein 4